MFFLVKGDYFGIYRKPVKKLPFFSGLLSVKKISSRQDHCIINKNKLKKTQSSEKFQPNAIHTMVDTIRKN
jgi:hypothetical protein